MEGGREGKREKGTAAKRASSPFYFHVQRVGEEGRGQLFFRDSSMVVGILTKDWRV